jgi:glycine cleavage system H lipoate-binding protein
MCNKNILNFFVSQAELIRGMKMLNSKKMMMVLVLAAIFSLANIALAGDGLPKIKVATAPGSYRSAELAQDVVINDLLKMGNCQVVVADKMDMDYVLQVSTIDDVTIHEGHYERDRSKDKEREQDRKNSLNDKDNRYRDIFRNRERDHYYDRWVNEWEEIRIGLNLKLIDVSGNVVWTAAETGLGVDTRNVIDDITYNPMRSFYNFMPVQGYIIRIEDNKYLTDITSAQNVAVKDQLVVNRTEEFTDPVTGKIIKQVHQVAVVEVVELAGDMVVVSPVSGEIIRVGDAVKRPLKNRPNKFLGIFGSNEHVY